MAEPVQPHTILVIGIGNTLRHDDGAGWLFAETLAACLRASGLHVHLLLQPQLAPELAEEAAELHPTDVIFVDASIMVQVAALTLLPEAMTANSTSHSLTPTTLLALMSRLYAVQARAWLVQTPAEEFGHGEGLSEKAQQGVLAAPKIASAFLQRTNR